MTGSGLRGLLVRERWSWHENTVQVLAVGAGMVLGALFAYLLAGGYAVLALAALLAVPFASVVLRHPQVVVAIWLFVTPFLVTMDGSWGSARKIYWVVHRGLPVIAVAVVVFGLLFRVIPRRVPRLGWPEAAMAGYLAVTVIGILYTSPDVTATLYHVYDRVFIPMCLYLLVRLWQPDERDLRWVVPVVAFLLLSQALVGILSWAAPEVLPSAWLNRAGLRTTGTLQHPNVYGTTVLFAGLLILHTSLNQRRHAFRRLTLSLLFPVALVMVFLTYSRASWLAAIVVVLGTLALYPRFGLRLAVVLGLLTVLLVGSGLVNEQTEMARQRFRSDQSEHSALSRLPVIHASVSMFQARPLRGWGYGSFDRVSPQFQRRVGALIVPDREHASHNLYLTLLAEQGGVGFLLYAFPAIYWFVASRRARRNLPVNGLINRKLVATLWLVLAAHVVVNNYSNMRVVFGLGIWWLTLGMIASIVARHRTELVGAAAPSASVSPEGGRAGVPARAHGGVGA